MEKISWSSLVHSINHAHCARAVEIMARFFGVEAMVRGYHKYKDIWEAEFGEQLPRQRETGNPHDLFAVAVLKSGVIVGHICKKNFPDLTAEGLSWLGFKRHWQLHEREITIQLQFTVLVRRGDRDSANLRDHVYVRFVLMGVASRIHSDFEISWINISWLASRPRKPRKFYPTKIPAIR